MAVNTAATAICASQRCKNRMSSYTDYLTTCEVENFLNDDANEVCIHTYIHTHICIS